MKIYERTRSLIILQTDLFEDLQMTGLLILLEQPDSPTITRLL